MTPPRRTTSLPAPHGLDPVDVCLSGYLVLSALLILLRDPSAGAYVPLLVRGAIFVIYAALRRRPLPEGRAWQLARTAYPILIYPYLYAELALLNQLVTTHRFDAVIVRWEAAIFGAQPSVHLREWLPWRALSEYLHLGYFSYYFVPTFTVIALTVRGRMRAVSETMTVITLTFATCYVTFILFPVVGPYHTFIPPDPVALGDVFPRITHAVVRSGSSPGTAFPSSHVAVAVSALAQAFRHDRRAGWILMAFVPALVVGTVYGGFHYALDALGGLVTAAITVPLGRRLFAWLESRRTRSKGGNPIPGQRAALARRS